MPCSAVLKENKKCKYEPIDGEQYCDKHIFFKDYTNEMLKDLVICNHCPSMHYAKEQSNYCPRCFEMRRINNSRHKSKLIKCAGKMRDGRQCWVNVTKKGDFCSDHVYMKDYTEDMMKNLTLCSGCKKQYYLPDGGTCDKCRDRHKTIRVENRIEKSKLDDCKVENCPNKTIDVAGYCGKHRAERRADDAKKIGKKVCVNNIRGCRNLLDIKSKYSRCDDCLEKERERDAERRGVVHNASKEHTSVDTFICVSCGKTIPIDKRLVLKNGKNSQKCKHCLEISRECEERRLIKERVQRKEIEKQRNDEKKLDEQKKEHKQKENKKKELDVIHEWIANINAEQVEKQTKQLTEAQIMARKKWDIEHADLLKQYRINSRNRALKKLGKEKYKELINKQTREYRITHPEIIKEIRKRALLNINNTYTVYINGAKSRGIEWESSMTKDICLILFTSQCHYCGKKYVFNEHPLGIDRVDNTKGYSIDNVVTCCQDCNFMKCTYTKEDFISICTHIYERLFSKHNLEPNTKLFCGRKTQLKFYQQNRSARKRNIETLLSKDEVYRFGELSCYICGKHSTVGSYCGIDRVDSNDIYRRQNCKACCSTCNYLKSDMSLTHFVKQIIKIVWQQSKSWLFQCSAFQFNQLCDDMTEFKLQKIIINDFFKPYNDDVFTAVHHITVSEVDMGDDGDDGDVRHNIIILPEFIRIDITDIETSNEEKIVKKRQQERDKKRKQRNRVNEYGNPIARTKLTAEEVIQHHRESSKKYYELTK